jgi:hypothetical protein
MTCPRCGNANRGRIDSIAANAAKKVRAGYVNAKIVTDNSLSALAV